MRSIVGVPVFTRKLLTRFNIKLNQYSEAPLLLFNSQRFQCLILVITESDAALVP